MRSKLVVGKLQNSDIFQNESWAGTALTLIRSEPLADMSIEDLFEIAKMERDGVKYREEYKEGGYNVEIPYGGSTLGNDEEQAVPEKITESTEVLKGDKKRYHALCDVIAAKLIHIKDKNEIEKFQEMNNEADLKTKNDVNQIFKDKYQKSIKDVAELSEHYSNEKERKNLVEPLALALGCGTTERTISRAVSHPPKISDKQILNQLRQYKDALINKNEQGPSIAKQLKQSGDPMIVKVLKGILFTLGTGLMYGLYALNQAMTGGSYKGIENAGEQLVKNAERRLFPEHYQSIHHIRKGHQEEEKTTPSPSVQSAYKP